jgi:hypothetical protein
MLAADPNHPKRPKLAACPSCGASGAGCDSLHWLRGQTCCPDCDGDHEETR